MQEGKVVVGDVLKIAEKRREVKGKGERERYMQLNAVLEKNKEKKESLLK